MGICAVASTTFIFDSAGTRCYAGAAHIHLGLVHRWGEDGGSGVLFFRGHRRYRILIKGIEFEPTSRKMDVVGSATNLKIPTDVDGTYRTKNGGSAIIKESKSVSMENEKGVILELHLKGSRNVSSVDLTGMTIVSKR